MASVKKETPHEQRLFMTKEEFGSVIKKIDDDINQIDDLTKREFLIQFRLLVIFLVNTGLRRAEALRLTESDINIPKRLLHITHAKSKRVRIIPLNTTAFQKLQEIGPKLFSHLVGGKVSKTFAQ